MYICVLRTDMTVRAYSPRLSGNNNAPVCFSVSLAPCRPRVCKTAKYGVSREDSRQAILRIADKRRETFSRRLQGDCRVLSGAGDGHIVAQTALCADCFDMSVLMALRRRRQPRCRSCTMGCLSDRRLCCTIAAVSDGIPLDTRRARQAARLGRRQTFWLA